MFYFKLKVAGWNNNKVNKWTFILQGSTPLNRTKHTCYHFDRSITVQSNWTNWTIDVTAVVACELICMVLIGCTFIRWIALKCGNYITSVVQTIKTVRNMFTSNILLLKHPFSCSKMQAHLFTFNWFFDSSMTLTTFTCVLFWSQRFLWNIVVKTGTYVLVGIRSNVRKDLWKDR